MGGGRVLTMATAPRPAGLCGICSLRAVVRVWCSNPSPTPCQLGPLPGTSKLGGGGSGPVAGRPPPASHTLCWDAPGPRSLPPASLEAGRGRTPGQFVAGRRSQGRGEGWRSMQTGDIGGRAAGYRAFGYRILAGTGPGSQGPRQGQKPLVRGTGSGTGTRPQSRC